MRSRHWILAAALVFSAVRATAQPISTPIETTFDQTLEGWAMTPGQNGSVIHAVPDGNPGGYARMSAGGNGRTDIEAPASYLGDWSALDGSGLLEFDHRIIAVGSLPIGPPYKPYEVFIEGPGGQARFVSTETAQTVWTRVAVPIEDQAWSVEAGTWAALLTDIQLLQIRIELVGNDGSPDDTNGIDNVRVSAIAAPPSVVPVMSPLAYAMLAASLVIAAWSYRRRSASITPPLDD
jgi:hypothetical protein